MFYKFRKIAEKYNLWDFRDKLLIAVSGGVDSIVLLDLCRQLYNEIGVVHCNFQLRGKDADADEQLVQTIAKQLGLQLHCTKFQTKEYAKEKGISIEMAARDLRYSYFAEICKEFGYTKILTAHHANDNAETLLLNLAKGTGIKGLTGIPRKRENIARPLLPFTRKEIEQYAKEQQLEFREDLTNNSVIYQRNKIRHQVLPLLEEINPVAVQTLNSDCERMQEVRGIYEEYIANKLRRLVVNNSLKIEQLSQEKYPQSLLYEWLSPYGFSATVVENILANIGDTEEKLFFTERHRLIKSRGLLQIIERKTDEIGKYCVTEKGISNPITLKINSFTGTIQKSKNIAYFDADKLLFPLELRRWQHGDRFRPFGMNGNKKLSELFKDEKLTTIEKENVWLLCSGKEIIWVVGIRASDCCKITAETTNGIQLTFEE